MAEIWNSLVSSLSDCRGETQGDCDAWHCGVGCVDAWAGRKLGDWGMKAGGENEA